MKSSYLIPTSAIIRYDTQFITSSKSRSNNQVCRKLGMLCWIRILEWDLFSNRRPILGSTQERKQERKSGSGLRYLRFSIFPGSRVLGKNIARKDKSRSTSIISEPQLSPPKSDLTPNFCAD